MFYPLSVRRRTRASARRQLVSVITAAFILLQPVLLDAPQAAAQKRKRVPVTFSDDTGATNISVTTLGTPIAQNFDGLASSGTSNTWTDNTTLAGWYARFGTSATDPTTYRASTGSESNGALYSYGPAGNSDRALGSVGSSTTGTVYWAVQLTNNTGSTIASLSVSFTGEQWRTGGSSDANASAAQTVDFQYQVANADVITDANAPTTGWVDHNPLDFTSPTFGTTTASALDGNAAANRTALSSTITGLSVAPGQDVWLRWADINHPNNDHGLAIDDFSVTANAAPPGATLAVNNVSQDEGNAGTTTFTFTVSLSAPAGPGGVTFDIATADGTAQDDNPAAEDTDYVGQSLTGQTIPAGSSTYAFNVTVNGDTASEPNETFFVNVTSVTGAAVTDGQGQGTIVNDDLTITLIHDVQGNGAASPIPGATVTVRGIVTLLKSDGFFIQEEVGDNDADPNTSEGIFVFTSSTPTVSFGDQATVTGTVAEFNNLTEITSPTVSVNSTGNTPPTAVTITVADLPPTANFAQPQLEKYEGMRLAAASLTTVAPNDNSFDVPTVITGQPRPMREPGIEAGLPIPPDPTSGTPDPNIPVWDLNPERLILDTDGRAGSTGATLTSNVVITNVAGPLDFSSGAYRLINEAPLSRTANMSAVPVPTPLASEFTVASYNIENFNNNATQRQKAALTVRDVLRLPDIIGVIEIFDLADLQALAAEIQTISGVTYSAHLVEANGTSGDDDQDVGFLVKTSRVSVTSVTPERTTDTYTNPNTGNPETTHDRPPYLLRGTVDPSGANPRPVLVLVNHLRSFIDIELVAGDGPRVRAKRKAQAESLAGLLQELQTNNPGVPVISVGDYNAYQFNSGYDDSVAVIKGNPTPDDQIVVDQSPDRVNPNFINLIDELPAAERYSFIFEGTPQALDHHIVNTAARARNTRTAIARVNADFPEVPAAAFASDASRPERNSDHDPVVSYYSLNQQQSAGTLVISEFRFRGPGFTPVLTGPLCGTAAAAPTTSAPGTAADNDEFVELYNNTDADITVSTTDGSEGWALVASDGVTRFVVPNDTVIPARGHFIGANSDGYSLACICAADASYTANIPDNGGVALFRTANPSFFDTDNRLDAAGYTTAPALYREGAGLPAGGPEFDADVADWSFFRDFRAPGGRPVDTGSNAADFLGVSTDGAGTALGQRLGAPGPENLASHIERNGFMPLLLLDATKAAAAPPNRVRDFATMPPQTNATHGTLTIRRRVVNNTGQDVTAIRFRIVNITTFPPATPTTADLRAISSGGVEISDIMDVNTCAAQGDPPPCTVFVNGTTLDEPPAQPNGGGWNSTLSVPVSIPNGGSVSVQFVLGIQQTGAFRFYINTEVLTEPVGASTAAPRVKRGLGPDKTVLMTPGKSSKR